MAGPTIGGSFTTYLQKRTPFVSKTLMNRLPFFELFKGIVKVASFIRIGK
jgi:hypothetical protein